MKRNRILFIDSLLKGCVLSNQPRKALIKEIILRKKKESVIEILVPGASTIIIQFKAALSSSYRAPQNFNTMPESDK